MDSREGQSNADSDIFRLQGGTTTLSYQSLTGASVAQRRILTRTRRSSSVISAKTTSTISSIASTLHDDALSARSVDIIAGGRTFHINRDASRISTHTKASGIPQRRQSDPPPYSPPEEATFNSSAKPSTSLALPTPNSTMSVQLQEADGRTTPAMIISSDEPDSDSPETPVQMKSIGCSQAAMLDPEDHSSMLSARFDDDALSIRSIRFPFLSDIDEDHGDDLTMQPTNDIGLHYSHIVHALDKKFRSELDARDTEMARMRIRLNEMDQVYRKELQQRTSEIDDLRAKLQYLQTETNELLEKTKKETNAEWEEKAEKMVAKARYQVEDSWELRWKERDTVLLQRLRRLENENEVLRLTNLELIRNLAEAQYKRGELDEKVHEGIRSCI